MKDTDKKQGISQEARALALVANVRRWRSGRRRMPNSDANGLTGAPFGGTDLSCHRLHLRLVLLDALYCRGPLGALEHGKGR